ncbi:HD domain-containing protein [Candidatus Bathyarchaeota archaeon]|nr:HD domain-containing protein [Candidatus Bathyarchaeota archaeon]
MGRYEDKALELASERHRGQLDDQGRPYFFAHIVQVHNILKTITDDESIICAGILHDIIEDTNTTYDELLHEFNREIAELVKEVTFQKSESGTQYFPNLKTRRAVMIKFADRLSNLSRMDDWPGDWQLDYLKKSCFWLTKP